MYIFRGTCAVEILSMNGAKPLAFHRHSPACISKNYFFFMAASISSTVIGMPLKRSILPFLVSQ